MLPDPQSDLSITPLDREIWLEELAAFLPQRIFDAHTHLWNASAARSETRGDCGFCQPSTDLLALRQVFDMLYPEREVHCLAFGLPMTDIDCAGLNRWVAHQVSQDPHSCGALLVSPDMSAEELDTALADGAFVALKPYHLFARTQAQGIAGYFPEHQMEVAHALRLPVVLHCRAGVVRDLAELQECARRYPGIAWVLAHCGAMFNPRGLAKSVQALSALPNIWYDTALICEIDTLSCVLKHADRRRVLFGTDSAVGIGGCRRGRVLSYGHSVLWLKQARNATFWTYEQLRALARCCDLLEIPREEVEDIFFANAQRLFLRFAGAEQEQPSRGDARRGCG